MADLGKIIAAVAFNVEFLRYRRCLSGSIFSEHFIKKILKFFCLKMLLRLFVMASISKKLTTLRLFLFKIKIRQKKKTWIVYFFYGKNNPKTF